jgi:hypothetical protein
VNDYLANSTSTLPEQPGVLVVRKHHFLVRLSHWLNVPILLGLILSGISIYWASPIYQHRQIRIQETSIWRRILESGSAPMCPDSIILSRYSESPDSLFDA